MKYVTYQTTSSDRQGRVPRRQRDRRRRLRRRHGRLHRGRRSPGYNACGGSLGTTRLLAPLRPRTIRDFLAFEGHLKNAFAGLGKEIPDEWYQVPAYYKGLPDTVIGPDDEIPWPSYTDKLDHELELAAVIGRTGKDITEAAALEHVFGYTIWNDMSARDAQTRELPLGMGPCKAKDWDGSNVLGPCIVTADEIDPHDVDLRSGSTATLGRRQHQGHAPHLRVDDRLRLAGAHPARRRGPRLGHGHRRLRPRARPLASARGRDRDGGQRHRRPQEPRRPEAGLTAPPHRTRTTNQGEEHGIRRSSHLEGQGRRGEARRGDHPQDDPAVARRGGQPLLPGPGLPENPARSSSTSSTSTRPATRPTRPRRTSRRTCSATSSSTSQSAR